MDLEKSKKVIQAWYELNNHPKFTQNKDVNFQTPHYLIDPMLENGHGEKSDNEEENIHLRYWYEIIIPYRKSEQEKIETHDPKDIGWMHVWKLEGGADTYEDAILEIHSKMIEAYGPFEDLFAGITIEQILGIENEKEP